ncbi:helix-turn-helix domain-containing protein [Nocardia cyriacigeorgica]|uniref:helix-turn-helix domain-containing protein n=1 Tax=Nocardia cyriacigeorgica TaxID=135487 RepID=UPI0018963202|nr:helix-turn-helix domain-containing protein [Nocardia cyriacigeorgica]MBF6102178.1 helix-turn-helix domain-containing protein [Nocardia cyriacigeorgica]MBF6347328.1 helix-turn-helix domain-containing protein [Nocardia cyriacigeorgica]
MGRPLKPIEDKNGPVALLAARLRARIQEDPGATIRGIAAKANCSHSTVSQAIKGRKLPTWEATRAVLRGCGAGAEEIESWHQYWQLTKQAVQGAEQRAKSELRGDDWRPRPDLVETFADLAYELNLLKTAVGTPALRALHEDMKSRSWRDLRRINWGDNYSVTALSDIFNGKRPPKLKLYQLLIAVLLRRSHLYNDAEETDRPWQSERQWTAAWRRAELDRVHPGSHPDPVRRGGSPPALPANARATAIELAARPPRDAAARLAGMEPREASGIITAMPPEALGEVLTAVLEIRAPARKRRRGGRAGGPMTAG